MTNTLKSKKAKSKNKSRKTGDSVPSPDKISLREDKISPCVLKNFTAHQFRTYRKRVGQIMKAMREARGLKQDELGISAKTIRRIENGQSAQVSRMHILARYVPCHRELLKIVRAILEAIPVACRNCRSHCKYKGTNEKHLIELYCNDLTMEAID